MSPTIGAVPPEPAECVGTVIGSYRLLEAIGEGGMGSVYMAEQTEPVRRRVALKVIKPGMDTKQVVARFEAERQALAMMDHPNIAKVLDAGTTGSGRPYFVMELVRGIPITDYCDREQLTVADRLELFALVCRAVQHAHQKGVIHRDIKPSNILVTVIDGVAVPKVIDFGVAKATGPHLTDRTLFTGFHQFVGTPLYMSPEQADPSGVDVDTRSDIYSLGVLLYELLTGTTPFDQEKFRRAAFDELRRIIREQEPQRPSARLSSLGETLSTVSTNRRLDPRRLDRSVRGELDWVVMKALEKDRRRRYESAGELAADVMNYLTDRPVQACPPSAWYRFAKYARRNRLALTAAGVTSLALLAGTAASAWQAVRAARSERRTAAALAEAEVLREQARRALDEMYTQVAEEWLSSRAELEPKQRIFLEKALAFYQAFAGERSADAGTRAAAADAYVRVALIHERLGHPDDAEQAYRGALHLIETMPPRTPGVEALRNRAAWLRNRLAALLMKSGRLSESGEIFRLNLDREEARAGRSPPTLDQWMELYRANAGLGIYLMLTRRPGESLQPLRRAGDILGAMVEFRPEDPRLQRSLGGHFSTMGSCMEIVGRVEESEAWHHRAVAFLETLAAGSPGDPSFRNDLASSLFELGCFLNDVGRHDEAERAIRRAIDLREALVREAPADLESRAGLVLFHQFLADLLRRAQRPAEADQALRRSAELREGLLALRPDLTQYTESTPDGLPRPMSAELALPRP